MRGENNFNFELENLLKNETSTKPSTLKQTINNMSVDNQISQLQGNDNHINDLCINMNKQNSDQYQGFLSLNCTTISEFSEAI